MVEDGAEALLKAASGIVKYGGGDLVRVALNLASRDFFNGWGRVWVRDVARVVGFHVDAARLIRMLLEAGYRTRFIEAGGGIIYIEM